MNEHYKIIIIGAGMAGLSAGIKLLETGISDFLILEGASRIGGRINTIPFQNSFIEMGAQWIHGSKGNPIYELSKALHMTDDKKNEDGCIYYATQDGNQLDENYVEKILDKIENIFDNLEDLIENELEDDSDQSLGEFLDDGFVKILRKLKSSENSNMELIKSIYRSRINEEKYDTACDDMRRLSAVGWNYYEDFEGDQNAILKYGYGKLIEYLRNQISKDCIRLYHEVKRIDWYELSLNKDKPIEIICWNRMTESEVNYKADYVICTSSLGYLKKHHYDLFKPNLPLNKIKAIENLGFGVVNKLFICFENNILKKDYEGLKILWRDDIGFKLECAEKKWPLIKDNKFYKAIDNFETLPYLPNVLICFVCGRDALFIEGLEEDCLNDVVSELFTKCFPNLNIPRPKQIIKSIWSKDEFANGSYTFVKTGSSINDVKQLTQSLNGRIYFSGEACTYKYMSTVHGAYISGRDTVNRILRSIKN